MAKKTTQFPGDATTVNADTGEITDEGISTEMPEEFTEIKTERYMYKADVCRERPLIGYATDLIDMPPLESGKDKVTGQPIMRDWQAILFMTTAPSLAVDRDGQVIDTKVGDEVLIPATHQLLQFLARMASHPTQAWKLFVVPNKKIDIGHGQQLWLYKLGYNKESKTLLELGIDPQFKQAVQVATQKAASQLAAPAPEPTINPTNTVVPIIVPLPS